MYIISIYVYMYIYVYINHFFRNGWELLLSKKKKKKKKIFFLTSYLILIYQNHTYTSIFNPIQSILIYSIHST